MLDGKVRCLRVAKRDQRQRSLNVHKLFHPIYFQYLCTEFDSHLVEIETASEDAFLSKEVKRLNGKRRDWL